MSTSLYQKYRPQTFADLVGQQHVRGTLMNELKNGTVAHAYLFSGPRGIGKTTSARLVARAVNCLELKEGEPCNACANCQMILAGKALDLVEIDAASNTGVDNVRENIIENARVAPLQLPWKVFIIDEVHMLSTSAFNALLKTLEEPPARTMFILATTEIHKVPATIISRCERFTFRKVGLEDMEKRLQELVRAEEMTVDADVIAAIAKRSEGALRDAESLLGQVLALDAQHITRELAELILPPANTAELVGLWEELVRGQAAAAIERVNRLADEGVMLNEFAKECVEFLRKILLYRVQESLEPLEYLDLGKDDIARLAQLAGERTPSQIAETVEIFLEATERSKTASIPQLPLELAILQATNRPGSVPAASAVAPTAPVAPPVTPAPAPTAPSPAAPASRPDPEPVVADAPAPEPPLATSASDLNLELVLQKWTELLTEMKRQNHALHLTFKVGQVVAFENGKLTMGFEYQFYQDRLNDARNRNSIDAAFANVFGAPVVIDALIGSEYAPGSQTEVTNVAQPSSEEIANVWDLAASSFDAKP